jgi:hypothetical protein
MIEASILLCCIEHIMSPQTQSLMPSRIEAELQQHGSRSPVVAFELLELHYLQLRSYT